MKTVLQLGLTIADLDRLEYGMVEDILIERETDNFDYKQLATQEDFDRF